MADLSTCTGQPPAVSTPTVKPKKKEKKHIGSASTALIFGTVLGLLQAVFLAFGAKYLLNVMGVKEVSFIINKNYKSNTLLLQYQKILKTT